MCYLINYLQGFISYFQSKVSFDTFFAAFLGFLSALIVEAIMKSINERSLRKSLVSELEQELTKVKEVAQENATKEREKMEFFLKPYAITVWKGACSSNSVLCLNRYKNYKKIIEVFEKIDEANEFEKECFYKLFSRDNAQIWEVMKKMLQENREEIAKETAQLLELLK